MIKLSMAEEAARDELKEWSDKIYSDGATRKSIREFIYYAYTISDNMELHPWLRDYAYGLAELYSLLYGIRVQRIA